jgi:hypothetical protein
MYHRSRIYRLSILHGWLKTYFVGRRYCRFVQPVPQTLYYPLHVNLTRCSKLSFD